MIAHHYLRRPSAAGLERLESLLRRRSGDAFVDFPAMADRRSSLADSLSALGLFSVLIAVLTAGSVIGQGYAYSDVVVLLGVQITSALAIRRFRWQRVSEPWLLAVVGIQAVFVASLIALTGGSVSPYYALYAPVLALAGWHLRPARPRWRSPSWPASRCGASRWWRSPRPSITWPLRCPRSRC